MRARLNGIGFGAQLALAFGGVVLLVCAGAALALWRQATAFHAVDDYFRHEDQMAGLARDGQLALAEARKAEQELLLYAREQRLQDARAQLIPGLRAQLASVRDDMRRLDGLGASQELKRLGAQAERAVRAYEDGIARLLEHLPQSAQEGAGLAGDSGEGQRRLELLLRANAASAHTAEAALLDLEVRAADRLFLVRQTLAESRQAAIAAVLAAALLAAMLAGGACHWLARLQRRSAAQAAAERLREQGWREDLQRRNRSLRMLSRCQQSLAGGASAAELHGAVCRILQQEGGYPLVWLAMQAEDGLVAVDIAATPEARLAATAAGWHHGMPAERCAGAGQYGCAHSARLRLQVAPALAGVIHVYTNDTAGFAPHELSSLQEAADSLAAALAKLRERQRQAALEHALDYQGEHDPVTGLANRSLFNDRVHQAALAAGRSGQRVAVLGLALDRYRSLKASLGHAACDALLKHAARAMGHCLRAGDTLARVSGNEFAVLVAGLAADEDVRPVAAKLLNAARQSLRWQGHDISSTASIGIALSGKDGADARALLCAATGAMAHAMGLGGNRFRFHAAEMNEQSARMLALEADLRRALTQQEMVLYYQPRASLADASLTGAQVLVRWQHPLRGLIAPSEFLGLAESSGLVIPLGAWVIRAACRQQRAWREAGLAPLPLAIKLTARQFHEEGLLEHIELALQENEVPPGLLVFEVAEAVLMQRPDEAALRLKEMKALGLRLSLDEFGAGLTSLSRLGALPLDQLMIGQSLLARLGGLEQDAAICRSMIELGHNLGLAVVADGVDTLQQLEWLRAQHCDAVQGCFPARPLPAASFAGLLAGDRSSTMQPLWRAMHNK